MKTTNNYGRKVCCHVCKKDELKSYDSFVPAFANAIDRVYVGWCDNPEHEKQAKASLQKDVQSVDRINQAGSNS